MIRFVYITALLLSLFLSDRYGLCSFCKDNAFSYQFFHANLLHLAMNCFCLYQLRALLRFRFLAPAYVTGLVAYTVLPQSEPVIGFSVIIFFLIGWISLSDKRILFYTLPFLIIGFFCPHVAAGFHLFAFAAGIAVAWVYRLCVRYGDFNRGYKG